MTSAKSSMRSLFLVVFLDLVGFGLVLPVIPLYAEALGGGPLFIGMVLSVHPLMQFLLNPLWGRLSDRIGRRPIILVGISGSVISYLFYALAGRFPGAGSMGLALLFISRVMAGVVGANVSTAQACVADLTTRERRAQGMGMVGAAIGLGFVLGPSMGALFTRGGVNTAQGLGMVGFAAAAVSIGNLAWALFFLRESLSREDQTLARRQNSQSRFAVLREKPVLIWLIACAFLVTISFSQFESSFSLLSRQHLGLSPAQIGLIFSYLGVIVVLMQGLITRMMVRRFGEQNSVKVGSLVMGLGLAGIPLAGNGVEMLLPLGLLGFGFGSVQPSVLALVSHQSEAHRQGQVLSLGQSISSLARIMGPLLAMLLYGRVSPHAPYWMAGVLAAGVAAIAMALPRSTR
ncbi:MAG: MFS transporter [Deltaproteobacteria bacterium]|nr:MFS transporter [Deltaproteobacteria bacterium]